MQKYKSKYSIILLVVVAIVTMPPPILAQVGSSPEADSTSVPELRESTRGEISPDSNEKTWDQQLSFQTARSVDPFIESLEVDLGKPLTDHSKIRKRWIWKNVCLTERADCTITVRVEALVVHDPTPVFIRLRNAREKNLLDEGKDEQRSITSYLQKVIERAYSEQ